MDSANESPKPKAGKKTGRPSLFTAEMASAICEQIAMGSSLRKIGAADSMPSVPTIMRWLNEDEAFQEQYARAREFRADSRADRIDGIIDNIEDGTLDPNAAKVMIDALKWQAGHEMPKRYGARLSQEISGPGGGPLSSGVVLSAEQIEQIERIKQRRESIGEKSS